MTQDTYISSSPNALALEIVDGLIYPTPDALAPADAKAAMHFRQVSVEAVVVSVPPCDRFSGCSLLVRTEDLVDFCQAFLIAKK